MKLERINKYFFAFPSSWTVVPAFIIIIIIVRGALCFVWLEAVEVVDEKYKLGPGFNRDVDGDDGQQRARDGIGDRRGSVIRVDFVPHAFERGRI